MYKINMSLKYEFPRLSIKHKEPGIDLAEYAHVIDINITLAWWSYLQDFVTETAYVQVVANVFDKFENELFLIKRLQLVTIPPEGFNAVINEGVCLFAGRRADECQRAVNVAN